MSYFAYNILPIISLAILNNQLEDNFQYLQVSYSEFDIKTYAKVFKWEL